MQWIKASERMPTKEAMYYCKGIDNSRMYIWNHQIPKDSSIEWLDESLSEADIEIGIQCILQDIEIHKLKRDNIALKSINEQLPPNTKP